MQNGPLLPPLSAPPPAAAPEDPASLKDAIVPMQCDVGNSLQCSTAIAPVQAIRCTVHQWLKSLSKDELTAITENYGIFTAAKEEWLLKHQNAPRAPRGSTKRRANRLSKLDHRIAIGLEYMQWVKGFDRVGGSKLQVSNFCKHKWSHGRIVPKAVKMWVTRCIKSAEEITTGLQPWKVGTSLRRNKLALVPRQHRMRKYGNQGRPMWAPMLRETLFDWFLSIRASVKARLPVKLVLIKAKMIATEMLAEMRRINEFVRLPILDKNWLHRWKKEYCITLRKPTKRYKVKRTVLRERLRAMWLTNVRIRALALVCLKVDLPICGFDQKGIYMNEAGSKNVGVLALDGDTTVALKDNHAASRTRVSLMTSVVSTQCWIDSFEHGLPIEIVFKGASDRLLKTVEKPAVANLYPPQWIRPTHGNIEQRLWIDAFRIAIANFDCEYEW